MASGLAFDCTIEAQRAKEEPGSVREPGTPFRRVSVISSRAEAGTEQLKSRDEDSQPSRLLSRTRDERMR
jgi:hypothetical protein